MTLREKIMRKKESVATAIEIESADHAIDSIFDWLREQARSSDDEPNFLRDGFYEDFIEKAYKTAMKERS